MKDRVATFGLFTLLLLLCLGLIYSRHQSLLNNQMQQRLRGQQAVISCASGTYQLLAQTLFEEAIQQEEILSLIHDMVTTEEAERRNLLRGWLFRKLDPLYQRVRQQRIRQLHFHYPDGRSLLRFHAPQLADDSLDGVRPSVLLANRQLRAVHGYESGRIFHGFRHVYPLFYADQHIGSVELSTSFLQIQQEMHQLTENQQTRLAFVLYKPEMWDKLFPSLQPYYQTTPLSPDYVVEFEQLSSIACDKGSLTDPLVWRLLKRLGDQASAHTHLRQQQSFILPLWHQGQPFSVAFHAIQNTLGKHAGYIVAATPEPFFRQLRIDSITTASLASLLLLMALLLRLRFLAGRRQQQRSSQLLQMVSDSIACGLFTADPECRITYVNETAAQLLGQEPAQLIGRIAHEIFHLDNETDEPCCFDTLLQKKGIARSDTIIALHSQGHRFPVEMICSPLHDGNKQIGTSNIFLDISTRRRQEQQLLATQQQLEQANRELQLLARRDGLTGIANRRSFDEALDSLWRQAARNRQPLSLLMIDIDHFKVYNDRFGHPQGDRCLQEIARLLQQCCLRPADLVCRYGGEEFAILLPETRENDALQVARRIQQQLRQRALPHPTSPSGYLSLSIGLCCLVPEPQHCYQELIDCADHRLYQAKAAGRDCICASDGP
ncbi:diguanylate cyclase [Desulfuromonas thiophila]|uniref:diguanylate cyclase n=1 Tax=Desulfuromonas thiophila TaxID=57664 RepID=UPI0029F5B107|nr:diguanylate cyclase [Desulfuromonas thiophila]